MHRVSTAPVFKLLYELIHHLHNPHQDEGAALITKDNYPKYYQQKENEFINMIRRKTYL